MGAGMILFIKHIDIEGPETLKEFFERKGFQTRTVDLAQGDALPDDPGTVEAVISLGGPMNVYEEEAHPFLKDEDAFLKKVVAERIPFIGICLGSQLLAKACGAKVGRSPEKEIGFVPVRFNENGQKDPLFEGLGKEADVFQWHEDMSEIPSGAELMASSEGCPHQAFKIGPVAYGLQFHVEVTESTIRRWAETYFSRTDVFRIKQQRMMVEDYRNKKEGFHKMAETLYENFLKIIDRCNRQRSSIKSGRV